MADRFPIDRDPVWATLPIASLIRLELGLAAETGLAMQVQAAIDRAKLGEDEARPASLQRPTGGRRME